MDRIAGAIFAAAVIISATIYFKPQEPQARYQVAASNSAVARLDTRTGEVVVCSGGACVIMAKGGEELSQIDQPD
jgi:hypothetical protein